MTDYSVCVYGERNPNMPKQKKQTVPKGIKKADLIITIKELNGFIDTPIPTRNLTPEKMVEEIKEAAEVLTPDDVLSEVTVKVLTALNCLPFDAEAECIPEEATEEATEEKEAETKAIVEPHNKSKSKTNGKSKPAKVPAFAAAEEEPKKRGAKPVKEKKVHKASTSRANARIRIEFMSELIAKGKYTKQEIVDKTMEKFPESAVSTVRTLISDGKNIKYNKFPKLLTTDEKGHIIFVS